MKILTPSRKVAYVGQEHGKKTVVKMLEEYSEGNWKLI